MAERQFGWDAGNTEHIWRRHRLTPRDAEQALADPIGMFNDVYEVDGEERTEWLGMTDRGFVLLVVYVERDEFVRPVSARRATRRERRKYHES